MRNERKLAVEPGKGGAASFFYRCEGVSWEKETEKGDFPIKSYKFYGKYGIIKYHRLENIPKSK